MIYRLRNFSVHRTIPTDDKKGHKTTVDIWERAKGKTYGYSETQVRHVMVKSTKATELADPPRFAIICVVSTELGSQLILYKVRHGTRVIDHGRTATYIASLRSLMM